MQGLGYLGRFRPFPLVIPDLWAGISRPRGGEDILGPPLVGFSLRSGGGLVAEDTVEVRLGARRYELTDWLGNVRVVVTDQRLPIYKGKKLVGYWAEAVEVRDYYRYGLDISDRSYGSPIHPYRYSFNGKEDPREKRW
jgi:predicted RNA-binding protein